MNHRSGCCITYSRYPAVRYPLLSLSVNKSYMDAFLCQSTVELHGCFPVFCPDKNSDIYVLNEEMQRCIENIIEWSIFFMEEKQNGVRINKYLSEAGICSRREADRQLEAGNIQIGGRIAGVGDRVLPGEQVYYQGKLVEAEQERILLVVNKPRGIVCTAEKREKDNIIDFLHYPKRIYPVGRLDKNSEGLLLMTNEGDIVNKIMRSRNYHEKEYQVTVHKTVTDSFLRGMAGGVPILDTMTRKCKVERTGKRSFRIILTQGLNRQIRRMCEYFDYRVVSLKRVRIMNIHLGNLPVGQYRPVTPQELACLEQMLADSSNETIETLWEEEE